jgi:serine/threonine protein kinase
MGLDRVPIRDVLCPDMSTLTCQIEQANDYIKSLDKKPGRNIESLYPAADPEAINLLKTMLMFNPAKRCTADEALEHEFLKPVRCKAREVRMVQSTSYLVRE